MYVLCFLPHLPSLRSILVARPGCERVGGVRWDLWRECSRVGEERRGEGIGEIDMDDSDTVSGGDSS